MLLEKGTFLAFSGSKNHLFFVCCDPIYYPTNQKDCFLAVNISSVPTDLESISYDTSCILRPGDHPFIIRDSYVFYEKAAIFGADTVINHMQNGDVIPKEPCSYNVFQRIINGFEITDALTYKTKRFYENYVKRSNK